MVYEHRGFVAAEEHVSPTLFRIYCGHHAGPDQDIGETVAVHIAGSGYGT